MLLLDLRPRERIEIGYLFRVGKRTICDLSGISCFEIPPLFACLVLEFRIGCRESLSGGQLIELLQKEFERLALQIWLAARQSSLDLVDFRCLLSRCKRAAV